ncbi:hypothetical protein BRL54_06070 [Corynebacterium ulcerans]|nr:hypothetical protein BRL54_06070 [Corynebacterium ulcerans]
METVDKLVTFLADEVFRTRLERPFTTLALLGQEGLEARGGWDDSFSRMEVSLRGMNVRLKTFRRWADALSGLRSRERLTTPIARDATCMLVFEPSGDRSFYLVEDQGVRTQRISRDDVVFQPAVEHKVRVLEQSQAPSILSVFTLPFDSVEVENPTWELYSYDVIPGFEVFLFSGVLDE